MLKFLVATTDQSQVDKLIHLKHIPMDTNSTIRTIRNPKNFQQTRVDVENIEVEINPVNYEVDDFLMHVRERGATGEAAVTLYKVEKDNFKVIRSIIVKLSSIYKEEKA